MSSMMQDKEGNSCVAMYDNGNNTIIYKYSETSYRGARSNGDFITLNCKTRQEAERLIASVLAHEQSAGGM